MHQEVQDRISTRRVRVPRTSATRPFVADARASPARRSGLPAEKHSEVWAVKYLEVKPVLYFKERTGNVGIEPTEVYTDADRVREPPDSHCKTSTQLFVIESLSELVSNLSKAEVNCLDNRTQCDEILVICWLYNSGISF